MKKLKPLMLDLFAGMKGASSAFKARGWKVVTVDFDPKFNCTYTADLSKWKYSGRRPTLIWASPPCTEFSREFMPWNKTGVPPDLTLIKATIKLIKDINPVFWVIENTKGAIQWFKPLLGDFKMSCGPYFLWGNFPSFEIDHKKFPKKSLISSSRPDLRAKIPEQISIALEREISNSFFFKIPTDKVRT